MNEKQNKTKKTRLLFHKIDFRQIIFGDRLHHISDCKSKTQNHLVTRWNFQILIFYYMKSGNTNVTSSRALGGDRMSKMFFYMRVFQNFFFAVLSLACKAVYVPILDD